SCSGRTKCRFPGDKTSMQSRLSKWIPDASSSQVVHSTPDARHAHLAHVMQVRAAPHVPATGGSHMASSFRVSAVAAALFLLLAARISSATSIPAGSTTGLFSDPLLSGLLVDPALPYPGNQVFVDNTNTAVFSGFSSNDITWGANPAS